MTLEKYGIDPENDVHIQQISPTVAQAITTPLVDQQNASLEIMEENCISSLLDRGPEQLFALDKLLVDLPYAAEHLVGCFDNLGKLKCAGGHLLRNQNGPAKRLAKMILMQLFSRIPIAIVV